MQIYNLIKNVTPAKISELCGKEISPKYFSTVVCQFPTLLRYMDAACRGLVVCIILFILISYTFNLRLRLNTLHGGSGWIIGVC